MSKINILDSKVFNKISAGEVVESPTSVVKELVENALDAGATKIYVELGEDLSCIKVSDNGCGIEKEDFEKVFLPHATSKISTAEDLSHIVSLGFRGEAMASIAAVSEVELISCVEGENGYSVVIKGGVMEDITPSPRDVGTTVTIRNLFYNTPARLKFMRKPKNEEHYITSMIQKLALANPFVVFIYSNQNGVILSTDGEGLLSAMSAVYGDEVIDKTIEVDAGEYGMRITGFVSSTTYPRPTRANQTFIVNGRVVTNIALVTALNNVYNDYFVKRYYPFAVLCLKVDPNEIDVNVHPTKAEIKFEYQSKVFGFVQRILRKKLEDSLKEDSYAYGDISGVIGDEWRKPFVADANPVKKAENKPIIPSEANSFEVKETNVLRETGIKIDLEKTFASNKISFNDNFEASGKNEVFEGKSFEEYLNEASDKEEETYVQEEYVETKEGVDFKYAGQLFGTYIILEYKDNALIIDQHAAAEFTLYSKLKDQIASNGLIVQPLMLPYEFKIDEAEVPEFVEKIEELAKMGIGITENGGNGFSLTQVPLLLVGLDVEKLISELLTENSDVPIKEKLMVSACRAAIKGNTYLDEESVRAFMINTFKNGINPKCPHGRPAYTILSKKDLEKMFMRIC